MEAILNENEALIFLFFLKILFFLFLPTTRIDDGGGEGDAGHGSDGDGYVKSWNRRVRRPENAAATAAGVSASFHG